MSSDEEMYGQIGSYRDIRRMFAKSTTKSADEEKIRLNRSITELIEDYEAEVNNGGIDQFFFNSTGDYALETVDALEKIQASKAAAILREACERFPEGKPPTSLATRRELMLATVSPESDAFHDLDERFFKYEENITELLRKYLAHDQ